MSIYQDDDGDLWVDAKDGVTCITDELLSGVGLEFARASLLAGNAERQGENKEWAERNYSLVELIKKKPIDINEVLGAAIVAYENTDSFLTPKMEAALTAAFIAAGFEVKK